MHWIAGLSALRGVIPTPPADDRSNRFSSSSADLLGMSSCWNNRRIPTGCWPTGVEGTCFETGNSSSAGPHARRASRSWRTTALLSSWWIVRTPAVWWATSTSARSRPCFGDTGRVRQHRGEKSAFLHASDLIEAEDEDEPSDHDDDNGNGGRERGGERHAHEEPAGQEICAVNARALGADRLFGDRTMRGFAALQLVRDVGSRAGRAVPPFPAPLSATVAVVVVVIGRLVFVFRLDQVGGVEKGAFFRPDVDERGLYPGSTASTVPR